MYVFVYVCMYVWMYECTCLFMYVWMYVYTYVCLCMYVCMYEASSWLRGPATSNPQTWGGGPHLISSQSSAAWHGLGPGQCMYGNMVGYHSVLDLPCIHTFIHKCIYMHTYTYIHTYIHTYIVGNPCMYVFMYQCAIISFILTYIHLSVKV